MSRDSSLERGRAARGRERLEARGQEVRRSRSRGLCRRSRRRGAEREKPSDDTSMRSGGKEGSKKARWSECAVLESNMVGSLEIFGIHPRCYNFHTGM